MRGEDEDVNLPELPLGTQLTRLDSEFNLVANRRDVKTHFPGLSRQVNVARVAHHLDPDEELVKIGRFELHGALGEGGFGAVYKAWDPKLRRFVALKLCKARNPRRAEALEREARALAKLRHPNIISVYDVGRHEPLEALYLVTEYVKSQDLFEHAVRERIPWGAVLDIFMVVGEALAAAHEQQVVHGDLKPWNIIVSKADSTPYIVDFGLARVLAPGADEFERAAKRGGTLAYMAPEQLRGGASSLLSDQYAFCVSLWQCLDRDTPYVGDDTDELLEDIEALGSEAQFFDAGLPVQLQEVLLVGLAAKPEDRYPDMRALLDALRLAREAAREQLAVLEVSGEPAPERKSLAWWRGALFGLALAVACAGILTSIYRHRVQEETSSSEALVESPFEKAEARLEAGDLQGCYDEWRAAYTELLDKDPGQAGRLSLELADSVAAAKPGTTTAAWIAVGAADAFEKLRSPVGWQQASHSRTRAAQFYTDAGEPGDASMQAECGKENLAGQPCQR